MTITDNIIGTKMRMLKPSAHYIKKGFDFKYLLETRRVVRIYNVGL